MNFKEWVVNLRYKNYMVIFFGVNCNCLSAFKYNKLFLRTKLDWCMPPIIRANRATKEIAQLYLNGDKEALLLKHLLPILGDRAKYSKEGKVLKRYRTFNYFSLRYD